MNAPIRPEIVADLRKQVVARAAEFNPTTMRWWVQDPPSIPNTTPAEASEAFKLALGDLNLPLHEPSMALAELHQIHDGWSSYGFTPVAVWGAYSHPPPNADGTPKKPGKTPKRAGFTNGNVGAERAALVEGDNIGVLGGAPLNGGVLCFGDLDFDDVPAFEAASQVPSLKGRPLRVTGKAGRGVIPFPVPEGTPYKKLEWKRASDGRIIAMELRSTTGHQTVVEGIHPETRLRIQWPHWSEPSTWSLVDPFVMYQEITAALIPLGWQPKRTFTAGHFKPKPQRQATAAASSTAVDRAQFEVSSITDAEWKHLERWFCELVKNRVTVESAGAVPLGQGGDWFRDNFLPGGLLGRKPGYNVDSWVEWAAGIASEAGRDVEHAKRSVRNALTTIEITTDNLGLRELENYRKRFAGTVSDEDAIAVVNAAPPNAITEAQKWAQDRLDAFLQESASDYWFVKLHIALDGGPEAVSGHEYLAEVARPLAPLVRAGKVDGESVVRACVAFASERRAETAAEGNTRAWNVERAEGAVRGALYHDPITMTPYTTKAGRTGTEYFPAGDYVLTVLRGMTPEANGTSDNSGFYEPEGVAGFKVKTPGEDWPAMEPLRADALPVPKFKEEHLPESLRLWAVDIAYRMRVALDVVAPLVIAALGIAIGARIALRPRAGDYTWSEVANPWMALVSRAGTLKTPVQNMVFAPLRAIAAEWEEAHRLAMDAFNTEHEKWDVEKSKLKETIRKGGAPLSDLDEINSREPRSPVKRRLLAEKAGSAVRLAKVMRDNPNGLGLVLDEMAPTLRKVSVEREDGDDLREILIKSWGGLTPHLYESEAQGEVFIPRACLAVVGSIQPGPFSEFIASAVAAGDDGLVQRFSMMVWPDLVRLPRPEGKPNADARRRADEVFRALVGLDPRATGAKQGEFDKVPHLEFVPEAQKMFEAWEDTNITKAQDEGGALGTHLDKHKTLTCGLAMLRELTDWASAPLSPPEPGVPWPHRKPLTGVGVGATKAAVELAGFFEAHARRAYGLSDASAVAARALATKVRDGEVTDGMTLRQLQRKKWPGLRLAHEVRDAVEMLQDLGWLKLEQKPSATPGRPTIIIKLHPDHRNGVIEELPAAPTG